MPDWIEVQLVDRRFQDRRLAVKLADDASVARNDFVALDGFDLSCGDIDHNVFLAGTAREFGDAGHIGLQLAQADGGGHVERGNGTLVGDAGWRQAVRRLEALDALLDVEVIAARVFGGGEIARCNQALAQQIDVRIVGTGADSFFREHRPATACDNILVAFDRRLHRVDIFGAEGHELLVVGHIGCGLVALAGEADPRCTRIFSHGCRRAGTGKSADPENRAQARARCGDQGR
jgi:hypothetical protein